jgi:hypothetical protein
MLKKVIFKSGVNRENTRYTTEGGWYECDKIRFRQGTPEKIGGWYQISPTTFLGVCRALWNWVTLGALNVLAVGTNVKYYIENGNVYNDITPIRYSTSTATLTNPFTTVNGSATVTVTWSGINLSTGDRVSFTGASALNGIPATDFNKQFTVTRIDANSFSIGVGTTATSSSSGGGAVLAEAYIYTVRLTDPFATVNASAVVTVTDTAHGCLTGDFANFTSTSTLNNVTITGEYEITKVNDNSYTIVAATVANATGSGGGAVTVQYQINANPEIQIPLSGWSAGPWGSGPWGEGIGTGTTSNINLGLWTQSNFGEDLIFGPVGGSMYYWIAADGVGTAGINISSIYGASDVPIVQNFIQVSDSSRFVFAFGCNDYGSVTQDPMLIRWSDQESITQWTPDATNQAGSIRLSHGSLIISVLQVRQEILVWTDSTMYSLQYLGAPAVWGVTLLADNISIMGPNAPAVASGVVYWMGRDKFYKYDGSVSTLNCDLRQYVFTDINLEQNYQVVGGTNEGFNEVWWFYCSGGSTVVDQYVIYNYLENIWYYGTMGRTAWLDSGLRNYPMAATYSNNIVFHEQGTDDGVLVPSTPIDSYIQSSEFDIDDGHNFGFIWRILPDLRFDGSVCANPVVTMSMYPLQNSGSGYNNPKSQGGEYYAEVTRSSTVPIEQYTGTIYVRIRGRQMSFKIEGNQLGLQWQIGAPRIDIRPDGRRGNT